MRQTPSNIWDRMFAHPVGTVRISSVVFGELRYGLEKTPSPRLEIAFEALIDALTVVKFDRAAAFEFGRLRATLARAGTPIGPYDLQIAAHALTHDAVLVTHNTREYARVPGLRLEDWIV